MQGIPVFSCVQKSLIGRIKAHESIQSNSKGKELLDAIANGTENGTFSLKDYTAVIETINKFLHESCLNRRRLYVSGISKRETMSTLVKSFFCVKLGSPCPKCDKECPTELNLTGTGPVCYECMSPGHQECFPNVNPRIGLLYICSYCSGYKTPAPPPADEPVTEDENKKKDNPDDVTKTGGKDDQGDKSHPFNLLPQRGRKYDRTTPICKFLKIGKCKFGHSGKGCPAYHPPHCRKFFKWGSDEAKGCQKGDKCSYLHPKQCKLASFSAFNGPAVLLGEEVVLNPGAGSTVNATNTPEGRTEAKRNDRDLAEQLIVPATSSDLVECLLFNIRGMNPSLTAQKHKVTQLSEWVQTSKRRTPFLVLTETHLNSLIIDAEVAIEGYSVYRADRVLRKQGGVAVYTRSDLSVSDNEVYSSSYCEASLVYMESANLIVVGIYRPPPSFSDRNRCCPPEHFEKCCNTVVKFCRKFPTATIVITGDFNLPFVNWNDNTINSGGNVLASERAAAEKLLSLMEDLMLEQVVTEPTRAGKNILDLVMVNNCDIIHDITVSSTILSDHDMVTCALIPGELPGINGMLSKRAQNNAFVPKTIFDQININKADWDKIRDDLKLENWEAVNTAPTQELAWNIFSDIVAKVCARHAPEHAHAASKSKTFIPRDRRLLLRKKRQLNTRVKAVKQLRPDNLTKLEELNSKLGSIELEMGASIANQKKREEITALSKMKTNPKAFYSYTNRKKSSVSGIGPLKDNDGILQGDPVVMANILQQQYKSVFSPPTMTELRTEIEEIPTPEKTLNDVNITADLVLKAIKDIPPGSAPGPDKFPAIVLKEAGSLLAPIMANLWRKSVDTGDIAPIFKQQTIVPVFKKGSRALPANYRPVSLTSHLAKVAERVIRYQLSDFVENSGFFSTAQHGGRTGRSCFTQLVQHIDDILHDLEQGYNVDVLYLDLSKAYDRVNHTKLLQKLESCGIGGTLHKWLKCFLTNRTQVVVVNGKLSAPADVLSGVPQGTVLAALLFLIYMNDIPSAAQHSKIKLFVDDAKVHKRIASEHDRALLLEDMERIDEWAKRNSMEFNTSKFQLLHHGGNKELKKSYTLKSGTQVESSGEVRDLGILIDASLSWKTHISDIVKKARKMASWILRSFSTRKPEHMLLLYKAYVRPHIEYCSSLWSPHLIGEIERLEAIQRSFTHTLEGCNNLDYWDRLKFLGLWSLQRRRDRFKILTMWKIWRGLLPNHSNITFRNSPRLGPSAERPLGKASLKSVNTMIYNSFTSSAIALFNAMPAHMKTQETLAGAKSALDSFLAEIPDKPPVKGYSCPNNNSVSSWLSQVKSFQSFERQSSGEVRGYSTLPPCRKNDFAVANTGGSLSSKLNSSVISVDSGSYNLGTSQDCLSMGYGASSNDGIYNNDPQREVNREELAALTLQINQKLGTESDQNDHHQPVTTSTPIEEYMNGDTVEQTIGGIVKTPEPTPPPVAAPPPTALQRGTSVSSIQSRTSSRTSLNSSHAMDHLGMDLADCPITIPLDLILDVGNSIPDQSFSNFLARKTRYGYSRLHTVSQEFIYTEKTYVKILGTLNTFLREITGPHGMNITRKQIGKDRTVENELVLLGEKRERRLVIKSLNSSTPYPKSFP
eukprot:sb/3460780/